MTNLCICYNILFAVKILDSFLTNGDDRIRQKVSLFKLQSGRRASPPVYPSGAKTNAENANEMAFVRAARAFAPALALA